MAKEACPTKEQEKTSAIARNNFLNNIENALSTNHKRAVTHYSR